MTTNYHTPHSNGAALTSANVNAPLGTLDAQITALTAGITGTAFDPLTYGADKTGVLDSTTACQNAIDAAIAAGGYVRFGYGSYKISAALAVSAPIFIVGAGGWSGRTIITQITAATHGFDFAIGADASRIEAIKLVGPTGAASGAGIIARKTVHMRDIWTVNFFDGIDMGISGSYYAEMDTVFTQNAASAGIHMQSGCYNTTLLHPRLTGNATGLSAVSHTNLRIFGGSAEQNTVRGMELTGTVSRGLLIEGTYFESAVGTEDIRLGGAATLTNATITGCMFADTAVASYWHVNAFGVTGLTLIGNKIGVSGAGGGSLQTASTTPSLTDIENTFSGTVTINAATKRLSIVAGAVAQTNGGTFISNFTRAIMLQPKDATLDTGTLVTVGAVPDQIAAIQLADAATQGAEWTFLVPGDWVSGVLTVCPVWTPGATDATAHTVQWSVDTKVIDSGATASAAGTTLAYTGRSAARTINVTVYELDTSTTVTPTGANELIRLNLRRLGADASDTYIGAVNLLGVIIKYTASR